MYFVSRMEKWAVSNVGLYNDRNEYNASSVEKASSPVKNTADPKLFETSRISPGSLRYYGLGLVNGPYIVRLAFAETTFKDPSTQTWQSRGRRVFDIYIQARNIYIYMVPFVDARLYNFSQMQTGRPVSIFFWLPP